MKKKTTTRGKAEKKKEPIRICYECGKAIMPEEPVEHIVTKRRTELWFHRECVGGRR